MANGKIIYVPIPTKAVQFDGLHYLSLDSTVLNFAAGDFAVGALIYINPAVADSESWIAAKGAADLAGAAGWHWYYKKNTRRLGLRINDGDVAATVVETADNQIPALGIWFWARVQADRDGQVRFYVNGVDVGGGSIAAAAGSLNNSEPLKVGGFDAATNRHQGAIDFLRFDSGRILSAAWHAKEWDNIRYGMPRKISDFLARWNFEESLVDDSDNLLTLTWQGGNAPAYDAGWPTQDAPLTYVFQRNFSRYEDGPEPSWLDTDDNERALSGAAFSYAGPLKDRWPLNFPLINEQELTAFKAAEAGRNPFAFYVDGSENEERTCMAKFAERLQPKLLMDDLYSLKMVLEEI